MNLAYFGWNIPAFSVVPVHQLLICRMKLFAIGHIIRVSESCSTARIKHYDLDFGSAHVLNLGNSPMETEENMRKDRQVCTVPM